jgi:hypothetical protein
MFVTIVVFTIIANARGIAGDEHHGDVVKTYAFVFLVNLQMHYPCGGVEARDPNAYMVVVKYHLLSQLASFSVWIRSAIDCAPIRAAKREAKQREPITTPP